MLFKLWYEETSRLPKEADLVYFYERFWDTWPWNLKFSLYYLGYIKNHWDRFLYGWLDINWADLWNLMFWYLAHHWWFYSKALERANKLEVTKFTKYYWNDLWLVRTEIDEANDIPIYEAWTIIWPPSPSLSIKIFQSLKKWLEWKKYTKEEATLILKWICDKTYGKYIEWATLAAYVCLKDYYDDYHMIVDKPLSLTKMVIVPRDSKWRNLIPVPVIQYE